METNRYPDAARMEKKELRRSSNILGVGLLLMYVLSFGIIIGLYSLVGFMFPGGLAGEAHDIVDNTISLIIYIISFIIPIIIIAAWLKLPVKMLIPMGAPNARITCSAVFFCLGCTIIGLMAVDAVSSFVQELFNVVPIMPDMSAPSGSVSLIIYCVSVVVAPAFLEEILFRGVIMQSLRRFGDNFAMVISAILFAMVHGNLVQGPNTLILGMVIGFFVMRTGSLWTGIIIHFANNGIIVAMDLIMTYTSMPDEYMDIAFIFLYVFAAVAALIYLLRAFPGFFRIPASSTNLAEGRKYSAFFITISQILLLAATIAITAQYFEPLGKQ